MKLREETRVDLILQYPCEQMRSSHCPCRRSKLCVVPLHFLEECVATRSQLTQEEECVALTVAASKD